MSRLSTADRKQLPSKDFALGKGHYPIENRSHAVEAERDVTLYGSPAQKAKVDAKVRAKFPNLGKKKSSLYGKD